MDPVLKKMLAVALAIIFFVPTTALSIIIAAESSSFSNGYYAEDHDFDIQVPQGMFTLAMVTGVIGSLSVLTLAGFVHWIGAWIQVGYSLLTVILAITSRVLIHSWKGQYSRKELKDGLSYSFINRRGYLVTRSYAYEIHTVDALLIGEAVVFSLINLAFLLYRYNKTERFIERVWDNARLKKERKEQEREVQAYLAQQAELEQGCVELSNVAPAHGSSATDNGTPFGSQR